MSVSSGLAIEARTAEILDAATKHDNTRLEHLIGQYKFRDCDAVDVQDSTGKSPLHAAVEGCSRHTHGESTSIEIAACNTVRLLLEHGAIWNQLDHNDETPGCIAFRLRLTDLYTLLVDAGVRAEVLLNRLEGYDKLDDEDARDEPPDRPSENEGDAPQLIDASTESNRSNDATIDVNSGDYLASDLVLTRDKLLDNDRNGVMMAWETEIMKKSVDALLVTPGLKILNIGAGMMIFDTFVQQHANRPEVHHIVEAHPDILANIESQGWDKKEGVVIHAGKWQEVLPKLVAENQTFDAIYYDTFAESYADFKDFFTEQVIGLLEQDGRWSYFNGMGADRQITYDVYQKVVEIDLFEAAFDVEWEDMEIPNLDAEFEGVKRKYWNVKHYRLPVCKFMD